MSSHVNAGTWTEDGGELLSQPVLNFFARRRIAISLTGFIGLLLFNLFVLRTIPLNPFSWSAMTAAGWVLVIAGLLIRSWASGTLNKSREVTRHGPYALTRNPLYLGSFLMMFAFCVFLQDWALLVFVLGPMSFLYLIQVRFEEKRLAFMFPNDWPDYTRQVPRFLPTRLSSQAWRGWTFYEWSRNREYKAVLATAFGIVAVCAWHYASQWLWQ